MATFHKIKKRLKIFTLGSINFSDLRRGCLILRKEALTNYFFNILTSEFQTVSKPVLDFREIVCLRFSAVSSNLLHVFLGCDKNPGPALALCCQGLRNGLEVQHELRIGSDELSDFINEEIQPESDGLLIKP